HLNPFVEGKRAEKAVELRFGVGAVQAQRFALAGCHGRSPEPDEMTFARPLGGGRTLGRVASLYFRFGSLVWDVGLELDEKLHDCSYTYETNCWPPSMSYVAPVRAVLVMMWTARAATSAGPTTRPIGSVPRSSSRRASSPSPRSEADK